MDWSPKQEKALALADDWIKNGKKQVFHLFGYAGTGKTTLAKHLAENVKGQVIFAAFTGKAAHVLSSKGCPAVTIHSLIYTPAGSSDSKKKNLEKQIKNLTEELIKEQIEPETNKKLLDLKDQLKAEIKKGTQPFFVLNAESEIRECSLVIIDECSMVDAKMGQDLLSFGKKVLVLGDPAQLPPVGGAGYFTEKVKPDIMLDEIHRQAGDSPIIQMATKIRNCEILPLGSYGNCKVIDKQSLSPELAISFDQILVGKNKTRKGINQRIRQLRGIEDKYPVAGDRVVCLRNDHNLGLLNGALFDVVENHGIMDEKVTLTLTPEISGYNLEVLAHEHHFLGKDDEINWYEKKEAQEFDYGYALTTHKAQGSQWKSVLVIDESGVFRDNKFRWLYTAVTRASDNLFIAR